MAQRDRGLGHKRGLRMRSRAGGAGPSREPAAPPPAGPGQRRRAAELRPGLRFAVAVTGSASNAGKTWLCERLITGLRGAGEQVTALKVTRTHVDTCPRENATCGVCDDLVAPWEVVTDPAVIGMKGKDTGRYVAAGAHRVLWLLVQPEHVARAVEQVLPLVDPGHVLVAEGNSFGDFVAADLTLMAITEHVPPKPSARHVLPRVHAFVAPRDDMAFARGFLRDEGLEARPLVAAEDVFSFLQGRLAAALRDRQVEPLAGRRGGG